MQVGGVAVEVLFGRFVVVDNFNVRSGAIGDDDDVGDDVLACHQGRTQPGQRVHPAVPGVGLGGEVQPGEAAFGVGEHHQTGCVLMGAFTGQQPIDGRQCRFGGVDEFSLGVTPLESQPVGGVLVGGERRQPAGHKRSGSGVPSGGIGSGKLHSVSCRSARGRSARVGVESTTDGGRRINRRHGALVPKLGLCRRRRVAGGVGG